MNSSYTSSFEISDPDQPARTLQGPDFIGPPSRAVDPDYITLMDIDIRLHNPHTMDIITNPHISPPDFHSVHFQQIHSMSERVPTDIIDTIDQIDLAIYFLGKCDYYKTWKNQGPPGDYIDTCGYSAPGMAILLLCFEELGIFHMNDLNDWLRHIGVPEETFMDIINETIANFLDIIIGKCPLTGVDNGIMGLIENNSPEVTLVDYHSITPGVNLISFTPRTSCTTVHHAVLYSIPDHNICIIIDSWMAGGRDGTDQRSRPISYRICPLTEIIDVLVELQTANRHFTGRRMGQYFAPDSEFIRNPYTLIVYKTSSPYILSIKDQATEHFVVEGYPSEFGGGLVKRHKYTNKKRKNIKRIKKTRNHIK